MWALLSALLLTLGGGAAAEPPSRAARLGELDGTVSFSPAGQPDWVRAVVNRPLTRGDRLWTARDSRAELQIGGAAIRMGPSTSMVLLNLDNRIAQLQLSQGSLKIRVRSLGPRQTFEVATPNLAFTLRRPGEYRIEVDPNDDATAVRVSHGQAEVYGQGASYTVDSRRAYRFYGTDLSDFETWTAQRDDELDRWSRERDRRSDRSVSARHVSSEVVGFEDLDNNGTWRVDVTYGSVWTPTRVASGWTPYRDGHWSWVDPWGWTWVDDAPWGYAVSHYGRWARIDSTWAWVPGPRRERAVYAPALVAFIGGQNFQATLSVGGPAAAHVGWFPLAPREVYQPSYAVSRSYFDSINRSNAVIAPATITNVYNTTVVNNTTTVNNSTQVIRVNPVVYANQQVAGAVIAVPTQAFVQSQPVAKARVQLAREALLGAPVVRVASVAPSPQSVQGGAREAVAKPPARVQAVVARTVPPPAPLPFAEQQAQLATRPGAPIDDSQRKRLRPAAPAGDTPQVSVLAIAPTASALPPATAPGGKTQDARKAAADKADNGRREGGRRTEGERAAPATPESAPAGSADARAADAKTAEAGKAEAARSERAKAEAGRADASKAQAEKAEAARVDAANSARVKGDAAKAAMDSAEASRVAAAKADAAKTAQAQADAGRAADAKAQSGRVDEAKAERARAQAAKDDAAKAAASAKPPASAKPTASAVQPGRRARDPKADAEEDREDGRKKGNKP